MTKTSKPESSFDFATKMAELERITQYLEQENVDLEEAIKKFEQGSILATELKTYLKTAENTINTLKQTFDKDTTNTADSDGSKNN